MGGRAVSGKRVSGMTDAPATAAAPRPVTYFAAYARYTGARERYDELAGRELHARLVADLQARADGPVP